MSDEHVVETGRTRKRKQFGTIHDELLSLFNSGEFIKYKTPTKSDQKAQKPPVPSNPPPKILSPSPGATPMPPREAAPEKFSRRTTPPASPPPVAQPEGAAAQPSTAKQSTTEQLPEASITEQLRQRFSSVIFEILQRNQPAFIDLILKQVKFCHKLVSTYEIFDLKKYKEAKAAHNNFVRAEAARKFKQAAGFATELADINTKREKERNQFMQSTAKIMDFIGRNSTALIDIDVVSFDVMVQCFKNTEFFAKIIEYTVWSIQNDWPQIAGEFLKLGFTQVSNIDRYNKNKQEASDLETFREEALSACEQLEVLYQRMVAPKTPGSIPDVAAVMQQTHFGGSCVTTAGGKGSEAKPSV